MELTKIKEAKENQEKQQKQLKKNAIEEQEIEELNRAVEELCASSALLAVVQHRTA